MASKVAVWWRGTIVVVPNNDFENLKKLKLWL